MGRAKVLIAGAYPDFRDKLKKEAPRLFLKPPRQLIFQRRRYTGWLEG